MVRSRRAALPVRPRGRLDSAGQRPPHLHVIVPSGVVLPGVASGKPGPGASGSVPVVVIGRFDAPGCAADPASCDHGFVVERLVWASGEDVPATALIEPGQGEGLSTDPPRPRTASWCRSCRCWPGPRRSRAWTRRRERWPSIRKFAGPFWYVRDVILARDGSLLPRWVLLDPGTGKTLATAPASPIGAGRAEGYLPRGFCRAKATAAQSDSPPATRFAASVARRNWPAPRGRRARSGTR
ncbi:MAG: hypothetical protein U0838_13740 [Chloroflexota bacterium]